jgi:aquaporin Z
VIGIAWQRWNPRAQLLVAELAGTACLLAVGLSIVVEMFGPGTPLAQLVPDEGTRRLLAGALFGGMGALIALSPVGKVSGAHLNPAVTLAFWLWGKIDGRTAAGYVVAQVAGGCLGTVPIVAWGSTGRALAYGATLPGAGWSTGAALAGEVLTTFAMVSLLILFLGFRELRRYTPALFPPLYAVMSFLEAPVSGLSTNPARSFGPALLSGRWDAWWIYWVGPLAGTFLATVAWSFLARRIEVAKLYHFDDDRDGLLRNRVPDTSAAT